MASEKRLNTAGRPSKESKIVSDVTDPGRRRKEGIIDKKTGKLVSKNSLDCLCDPPTKYNEGFSKKLPDLYRKHKNVFGVCEALGISHNTYYRYVKLYPEFKEAHDFGKTVAQSWLSTQFIDNFQNKNANQALMIFFAKTQGGWNEYMSLDEEDKDNQSRRFIEETKHVMDNLKKIYDKEC